MKKKSKFNWTSVIIPAYGAIAYIAGYVIGALR